MGSMDKEEQHRLRSLLVNALTVICRSSLGFRRKFTVEGLLGITLDEQDIILVNVNELVHKDSLEPSLDIDKEDVELEHHNEKQHQNVERKSRKRRSPRKTIATWDSPLSPDSASESGDLHLIEQHSNSLNIKGEPGEDGGYGKMPRVIAPSDRSPSCTQTRRDSMPLDLLPDDLDEGGGHGGDVSKGRESLGNKDDAIQCTSTQNSVNSTGRLLSTSSEEGSTSQPSNQEVNQFMLNYHLMASMATQAVSMATPIDNGAGVSMATGFSPLFYSTNRKVITCKGCGREFSRKYELIDHAIATGCKNYGCQLCSKWFVRPQYLEQHMRVVHEAPRYECAVCGQRFKAKHHLARHTATLHPNSNG